MQREPLHTEWLQAFVHVVEGGSVSAAARELNLPRATVSRRLGQLEERLAVRLLHRTTRSQGLTEAGHELFHHARTVLQTVREAEDALRRADGQPRGLLRVSLPPGEGRFRSMINGFLTRYPEVQLEIDSNTRFVDLIAEGFDVVLRAGRGPIPEGLIARRLRTMPIQAWASPGYAERRGLPERVEQLAEHDLLLAFAEGVRPVTHWPLLDGGRVRVRGRLATNALPAILGACADGLGIALLPADFVAQASGPALLTVLPDQLGAVGLMSVVYAERLFMPPAVRAFVDHLIAWAGDLPPATTLSAEDPLVAGS